MTHTGKTVEEKIQLMSELNASQSIACHLNPDFCGCCAGHVRYSYQRALGVELRLKEIVSSPLDSDGKNHCEFPFEIVG